MKPSMILFLFVFFQNTHAFAGNGGGVGNGGDAVVCRDSSGNIRSAEALDRYEARTLFGMTVHSRARTRKDAVAEFLGRLAKQSPFRAAEYLAWAKEFDANAEYLYGQELIDVPDSEHVSFPRGCGVEQLVIQKVPKFAEEKRYTVNGDIWNALNGIDQAIVIVHEMILREMINVSRVPIQTRELRYLNAKLFSGEFETMSYDEVFDLMQKVPNLEFDEHPGVVGRMSKVSGWESAGQLKVEVVDGVRKYFFKPSHSQTPKRFRCFLRGYEIPTEINDFIEIGSTFTARRISLASDNRSVGAFIWGDSAQGGQIEVTIRSLGNGKFEAENLEGQPKGACRTDNPYRYLIVRSFEVVGGKIARIHASTRYPGDKLECGDVTYFGTAEPIERDGEFRPIEFQAATVKRIREKGNFWDQIVGASLKIEKGAIHSGTGAAKISVPFGPNNHDLKFLIDLTTPLPIESPTVILAQDLCFRARNGNRFPRARFSEHRFRQGDRLDIDQWVRFDRETGDTFRACK
jgi:hypothetical protein